MSTTQVATSRSPATGPPTTWGESARGEAHPSQATAVAPARAYLHGHARELADEHRLGEELTTGERTGEELTVEEASRLAVTALAADLEFWAREVSVDGWVGVNDLIRTLDLVREAGAPAV
jgi:hypothetical protein